MNPSTRNLWARMALLIALAAYSPATLAQNTIVNYQGRITVHGTNFIGAGLFKFALVTNRNGTAYTFWSNDGRSVAGSEPQTSVTVGVADGVFSVGLGDATLANMQSLAASLFEQPNLQLLIWFNDGVNGFVELKPPQNLTGAPYAASAQYADNVVGSVPAVQLSGTLPDARLSSNVALLNASQTFTGAASFLGNVTVGGAFVVNNLNNNTGAVNPGLTFGYGSGEGIGSKRDSGGNQYGLDFYTHFLPRMSIDGNNGNVGIGTTNPAYKLDVNGPVSAASLRVNDSNVWLRAGTDNNHGLGWFGPGKPFSGVQLDGPVLFGYSGGALGTEHQGTETIALAWNQFGNVGIGTTTPTAKMDVNGTVHAAGDATFRNMPGVKFSQSNNGGGTLYYNIVDTVTDAISIFAPATGFVIISAHVHTEGPYATHEDFKILQGTTELARTTSSSGFAEHSLTWVIQVTAGAVPLYATLWRNEDGHGNVGANFFSHNLTAIFVPVQY